nr:PREDICTED: dynein beta chain, flagellar outer arm-like [Latimeria chalumnae]|eukprot:XP_014352875.1 PREDICTED: dynein beta chain, flagellar outer arm-like [Latimeria chalumnae]
MHYPEACNQANEDTRQFCRTNQLSPVFIYLGPSFLGQRVLFLLTEDDINEAVLVYMSDLVVSGTVSHLFTAEQQASITNAIRNEVTSEGLTYTKDAAWQFFLKSVQQNFRLILVCSSTGALFHRNCREFPALLNTLNVYFIPHWSKEDLVAHAYHHVQDLEMLGEKEKENVCHLLASMHLSISKHDNSNQGRGKYGQITNVRFEKFVQCFVALMKEKYGEVMREYREAEKVLLHINDKIIAYATMKKNLSWEKVVLEEHKQGTIQILTQIAQDKTMVGQQFQSVNRQFQKLKKVQKRLPEYQLAHERAIYKASAIGLDTKKHVQQIDISALGELRGMQKPAAEIEELMASIIIVLKGLNADLTWSKGAKRQMANLDRFLEELSTFDEIQLPEATLEVLETKLKSSSFTVENMVEKAGGNGTVEILFRWLQGAVRYHRLIISKVKPLHNKVKEMTAALEQAEQKMKTLQNKKDTLLTRLNDLEKAFEEATIDKNKQQQKAQETSRHLGMVSEQMQVLEVESKKYIQITSSISERLCALPGSMAIAAGLVSYLGAYEHLFRQLILALEWPACLKVRGFSLLMDFIDPMKGRVTDFSVEFFQKAPEEHERTKDVIAGNNKDQNGQKWQEATIKQEEPEVDNTEQPNLEESVMSFLESLPAPVITEEHYQDYVTALLKTLVKEEKIQEWIAKDWTLRQMENAAILFSSWQQPALLMDPCNRAEKWFNEVPGKSNNISVTCVSLGIRQENNILSSIEKSIGTGSSLFLLNYTKKWDSLLRPLIDHCSVPTDQGFEQSSSDIICFNGRKLLCSCQFELHLATSQAEPHLAAEMSSRTTLLNYSPSEESLTEELLHRAFANTQSELHNELKTVNTLMKKLGTVFIPHIMEMWNSTNDGSVAVKLQKAKSLYMTLLKLRNELLPLARRGGLLYSIMLALRPLLREYHFSFCYFLQLFDKTVGTKATPQEDNIEVEDVKENMSLQMLPQAKPQQEDYNTQDSLASLNNQTNQDESNAETQCEFVDLQDDEIKPIVHLHLPTVTKDTIIVPQGPELPSPDVEYLGLSANRIRQLVDELTQTVCTAVAHLKTKDHLLKKNFLFSYKVAKKSLQWENWYNSDCPELEHLPLIESAEHAEENLIIKEDTFPVQARSHNLGSFSDFHQLLLLQALRPDRLPAALFRYISNHMMTGTIYGTQFPGIDEIAGFAENTLGILVFLQPRLLCSNSPSISNFVRSAQPITAITITAEGKGIPVSIVSIMEGCEADIETALDDAVKQEGWLIIENLQLASEQFLQSLHQKILCAKTIVGTQNENKKFCLWLMTEPGAAISEHFLSTLHKVSWHVLTYKDATKKAESSDMMTYGAPGGLLFVAILSALEQVSEKTWRSVQDLQPLFRSLCFTVCILHGMIQGLLFLPTTGLSQLYPVSCVHLNQAIDCVICIALKSQSTSSNLAHILSKEISSVYTNLVASPEDATYIKSLIHEVMFSCVKQTDLKRAHNQLIQWLKTAVTSTEKTTGCVSIPLWLGGLVNPGALFLALKYEYAGYHGCFLDEPQIDSFELNKLTANATTPGQNDFMCTKVVLRCHISRKPKYKPETSRHQLSIQGLFLQGASWDYENNCLDDARDELILLPCVAVTPLLQTDVKAKEDGIEMYNCPLYLDKTRQSSMAINPLVNWLKWTKWYCDASFTHTSRKLLCQLEAKVSKTYHALTRAFFSLKLTEVKKTLQFLTGDGFKEALPKAEKTIKFQVVDLGLNSETKFELEL